MARRNELYFDLPDGTAVHGHRGGQYYAVWRERSGKRLRGMDGRILIEVAMATGDVEDAMFRDAVRLSAMPIMVDPLCDKMADLPPSVLCRVLLEKPHVPCRCTDDHGVPCSGEGEPRTSM